MNDCRSDGGDGDGGMWKGLDCMTGYGNVNSSGEMNDSVCLVNGNGSASVVYKAKDFDCRET